MRISDWSSDVCSSDLIRGPLDPVHHLLDGLSNTEQFVEIVAEHLDRDIGADARKQLVEPHLDGLGELVVVARNGLRSRMHLSNQIRAEIGRASCRERVCQYV